MNAEFFDNWTGQIRKGLLDLAILNDIRKLGMYGYEIEKRFCKTNGLILSTGAIYNILRRLRVQRLVETKETESPDGPKRKYYRLTAKGRDTLAQMNSYWYVIKKQLDCIRNGK